MPDDEIDARTLVETLRAKVDSVAGGPWAPPDHQLESLDPIRYHLSLTYLHQHWDLHPTTTPPSLRAALKRGPRAITRAIVQRLVFSSLRPYLDAQHELVSHMVRMHDAVAKRCDELDDRDARYRKLVRSDLVDLAVHLETLSDRATALKDLEADSPESH